MMARVFMVQHLLQCFPVVRGTMTTFEQLNISKKLVDCCKMVGRNAPDEADIAIFPRVLNGEDTLCIGHTTVESFVVPILETLIKTLPPTNEKTVFALIVASTREFAMEICEHFRAYGYSLFCGLTSLVLYGSHNWDDLIDRPLQDSQRFIVATTPPDLHAQFAKGQCPFSFSSMRYLVIYEACQFDEDYCSKLNVLLPLLAGNLHTYIFATRETQEVSSIQKKFLRQDSIKIKLASKDFPKLKQHYCICADAKDGYVLHILRQYSTGKVAVFVDECYVARKLALALSILGFKAIHIVDQMNKKEKQEAAMKFFTQPYNVLVCSTLASHKLGLPLVDAVINYDLSVYGIKKYFYQVGRCACQGWGQTYQLLNDHEELEFEQLIFKFLMDKEDERGDIDTKPIDRDALANVDTQSMDDTEYKAYRDSVLKEGISRCTWHNISRYTVGGDEIGQLQSEARKALREARRQMT